MRSLGSSSANFEGGERGLVNALQRDVLFLGEHPAAFVFRSGLKQAAVQPTMLHLHWAKGGLDGGEISDQLSSLRNMATHAESRRFFKNHFAKGIRLSGGAEHGEQHTGPILLHLNGGIENIQRTATQGLLDEGTQNLRVYIVQIALQDSNLIGFPADRNGGLLLRAEHGTQNIWTGLVIPGSNAETDTRWRKALEEAELGHELGDERRACGSYQFMRFLALGDWDLAR